MRPWNPVGSRFSARSLFTSPVRFAAAGSSRGDIAGRITTAVLLAALFVAVLLGTWGVLTLIAPPRPAIEVRLGCVIEHDVMPEDVGRAGRLQQLCRP